VAEFQPWRNPRPAPQLQEIQARLQPPRMPALVRAWWPVAVWACFIFTMSTDTFSAEHTRWFFEPILHWMFPSLNPSQLEHIHHLIRKCAHFTEYFIFFLLLYRGVRGERKGWRWTWGVAALSCAAGYSALDEIHQAFVASRTASPYDSLLDSIGAFAAFVALWMWFRRRRSAVEGEISANDAPAS
jgi:VanZ family protein